MGPYSKWQSLTAPPLGLTVAFTLAEVCVTNEAGSVVAVGGTPSVVNAKSEPALSPPAFFAKILKW